MGEWNHFEITVKGKTVTIALNGKTVIPGATIPSLPDRGRLAFQHHGSKKDGAWAGPPSLVQFKNVYIKRLPEPDTRAAKVKALLITGGHDHDAAFYGLFQGYDELDRLPVVTSATAFKDDLRGKYDVVIMYDFTRELDEPARKNLRDFVEAGGGRGRPPPRPAELPELGLVGRRGGRRQLPAQPGGNTPSSSVKDDQQIDVTPAGDHPVTAGLAPFHIQDEAYKNMRMSPKIRPLLTTDNPTSDPTLAWVGPLEGSKVVAIQLGHGRSAFGNPSYRALVHNAVLWAAGKSK